MLSAALTMLSINLSNMKNGQTNQQATINNQTKSSRVQSATSHMIIAGSGAAVCGGFLALLSLSELGLIWT
jgi:hypothetical protein